MSRTSDLTVEQTTLLGGQISKDHKRFKLARMSPEYAEIYAILDELPKLMKKLNDPLEFVKELLSIFGEMDRMRSFSELTILSAIVGDRKTGFSMKRT